VTITEEWVPNGPEKIRNFGVNCLCYDVEDVARKKLHEIIKEFFPDDCAQLENSLDVTIRKTMEYYPNGDVIPPISKYLVAYWRIREMPGCCGVVVSTQSTVFNDFKGKGLGQKALQCRIKLAEEMGYSQIVCTVTEDNAVERHILEKYGFKQITDLKFGNKRTGNTVLWYSKLV